MAGFSSNPSSEQITYALIRTAVMERQPISAIYYGHARLLCPHRLGWNSEGRPQVLCYQYGGGSRTGLKGRGASQNWRCLAIEKLREVKVVGGRWQTAPNHSQPQKCVAQVDVDAEDYPGQEPQNGH